jgi:hypothetical protein
MLVLVRGRRDDHSRQGSEIDACEYVMYVTMAQVRPSQFLLHGNALIKRSRILRRIKLVLSLTPHFQQFEINSTVTFVRTVKGHGGEPPKTKHDMSSCSSLKSLLLLGEKSVATKPLS